jgi:CheY-like chemotaxis protein
MCETGHDHEVRDILVVDDHTRARQYMSTLLSAVGYRISVACDGSQALSLLLRRKFDLLITDLEMRPLDGYGLIALMSKLPPEQRIPKVVVCSAHVGDPDVERRPELRGARLVAKPIHPRELLVAVAEAFPRKSRVLAEAAAFVGGLRRSAFGLLSFSVR